MEDDFDWAPKADIAGTIHVLGTVRMISSRATETIRNEGPEPVVLVMQNGARFTIPPGREAQVVCDWIRPGVRGFIEATLTAASPSG